MAISGSFYGTTSNGAIKPKITWTAQADLEGNYSDVTVTLTYSRTDSYQTYGYWGGSLTVDGNTKTVSGKYLEITKNSNTLAVSYTLQIPHNDDGSKTVAISASGSISGTTLSKTTVSGQVTLEQIPRAAAIAATDAAIGSVSTVTIGKKSEAYTYTVAWKFGSLSGYLTGSGSAGEPKHVTASGLAFPLPEDFYYEIPDRASDTCTLTCVTYLNAEPIGSPQQTSFQVWADPARCGPLLTAAAEDINEKSLALTGNNSRFIRSVSTAKCTMTVQARYGASVARRKIDGKTVTADSLSLPKIEGDTVRFSVTDSRGYTAQATLVLDMIPYAPPTARLSAGRTDPTSGNGTMQAEGSFYNGSFGEKANSLQVRYRIGNGEERSLSPGIKDSSYSAAASLQGLTYTDAYTLTVTVSDALSSQTASVRINPGIPHFDWGKEDFVFHVPVSMDGKKLTDLADPENGQDAVNKRYADGRYLKNTGNQKLDGLLFVKGSVSVVSQDDLPRLVFRDESEVIAGTMQMDAQSRQIIIYQYSPDGSGYRVGYRLPGPGALAESKTYELLSDRTHGMVKLWQNASPDSGFEAQTLSVELSDYDGVSIYYRNDKTGTAYQNTGLIPKGNSGAMVYVSSAGKQSIRKFSVTESGITFEAASYDGSDGKKDYIIPVIVYGIKGVSA